MGGVGMLGGAALDLPSPWITRDCNSNHGVWMYPPEAAFGLDNLIRNSISSRYLNYTNDTVAHAANGRTVQNDGAEAEFINLLA
jgi:alcohol dehydrogenase